MCSVRFGLFRPDFQPAKRGGGAESQNPLDPMRFGFPAWGWDQTVTPNSWPNASGRKACRLATCVLLCFVRFCLQCLENEGWTPRSGLRANSCGHVAGLPSQVPFSDWSLEGKLILTLWLLQQFLESSACVSVCLPFSAWQKRTVAPFLFSGTAFSCEKLPVWGGGHFPVLVFGTSLGGGF